MFAGPNGSGKSTIKLMLSPELLGVYINPDEIEKEIRTRGDFLDLAAYKVHTTAEEILSYFQNSTLLTNAGLLDEAAELRFSDGKLGTVQKRCVLGASRRAYAKRKTAIN